MFPGRVVLLVHSAIGQGHMLNSEFASSRLESPICTAWLDGATAGTLHPIKAIHRALQTDGNSGCAS